MIYSDNGDAFSEASYENAGGPGLGGETTLELDYQYNPTPWLSIQPDMQYIIDPGGDYQRRDNSSCSACAPSSTSRRINMTRKVQL